jgi:hypothetical protein
VKIAVHAWMLHGKTFFAREIGRGDADDDNEVPLLRDAEFDCKQGLMTVRRRSRQSDYPVLEAAIPNDH